MSPLPPLRRKDVIATFRALGWRERETEAGECVIAKPEDASVASVVIPRQDPIDGMALEELIDATGDSEDSFIDAALVVFEEKVVPTQDDSGDWKLIRTAPEEVLEIVGYYKAVIDNSGDVFGWMTYFLEYRWAFEAIGARDWLKLTDELLPLYEEQQRIPTEEGRYEYWSRLLPETRRIAKRSRQESQERLNRLLLFYVVKKFPTGA